MREIALPLISGAVLIAFLACYPTDHQDVPDKAEVVPNMVPVDLPSPTPEEKSACEYEVESLTNSLDACREQVRTFCESDDDDD